MPFRLSPEPNKIHWRPDFQVDPHPGQIYRLTIRSLLARCEENPAYLPVFGRWQDFRGLLESYSTVLQLSSSDQVTYTSGPLVSIASMPWTKTLDDVSTGDQNFWAMVGHVLDGVAAGEEITYLLHDDVVRSTVKFDLALHRRIAPDGQIITIKTGPWGDCADVSIEPAT